LVAIIKARTAEDLRNVELMAVILVITVHLHNPKQIVSKSKKEQPKDENPLELHGRG
jgi:hypothetical protein